MEHPSHDESDRTSPRRGTSLVAPIRAPSDLPGDRNCLSDRYETDEQGFSGPRRYLSVDRALHKSGSDSVVQHYFRFSRRGAKRTPRNRELHDGYLPEVQWRGILDEHFHALSGGLQFSIRRRSWESKYQLPSRVGRIISRVTQSSHGSKVRITSECKPCEITCGLPLIALRSRPLATGGLRRQSSTLPHTRRACA